MFDQNFTDLINATKAHALNIGALVQAVNNLTAQLNALFP